MNSQFPFPFWLSNMPFLLVTLALMCQEGIHGKAINSLFGPYISYAERFYNCEPEPDKRQLPYRWYVRSSHFNPRRPKELQIITGNVTHENVTLDDNCWLKGIVDTRSNNQWKENAFVFLFKNNACRSLRENVPGFYEAVFKKNETKGVCKLKTGVYVINDIPIDWTFPKFPIMPYGHYRYRVMFGKAEKLYGCYVIDCMVIPKPD